LNVDALVDEFKRSSNTGKFEFVDKLDLKYSFQVDDFIRLAAKGTNKNTWSALLELAQKHNQFEMLIYATQTLTKKQPSWYYDYLYSFVSFVDNVPSTSLFKCFWPGNLRLFVSNLYRFSNKKDDWNYEILQSIPKNISKWTLEDILSSVNDVRLNKRFIESGSKEISEMALAHLFHHLSLGDFTISNFDLLMLISNVEIEDVSRLKKICDALNSMRSNFSTDHSGILTIITEWVLKSKIENKQSILEGFYKLNDTIEIVNNELLKLTGESKYFSKEMNDIFLA